MQTNALISVIMPAYNHEKYVQDSINSIINQTYKNIELIIIDDGSTNSTLSRIEEMREVCEKRFIRFIVINQDNKVVIQTENWLLNLAEGEYVYPFASDDKACP